MVQEVGMFVQEQLPWNQVDDESLSFFKAIGVDYLTVYPPPELESPQAMDTYLAQTRRLAEAHGLRLYNVAVAGADEITLALPGRDGRIEWWQHLLRALGRHGVPTLGYNFKPVGNLRTSPTCGRGGSLYSTFDYDELMRDPPLHPHKRIDEEQLLENLGYFLQRVIPVAEESGVRLALHADDPPIPEPLGGAARIVSTLDQYRRIFALVPSPANAMLFCQGCVTEMGVDVYQAIQDMGSLGKIAYVHFRNVRGAPRSFQEVFVDEGQVDMHRAMQTYAQVGFKGPFMMDHTPEIPGDRLGREGRAFAVGYIRAMIQAVYR
jgi:mannonate dehydratase